MDRSPQYERDDEGVGEEWPPAGRRQIKTDHQFIRKFNSVVVPKLTGLPKDEKEDAEKVMREQR